MTDEKVLKNSGMTYSLSTHTKNEYDLPYGGVNGTVLERKTSEKKLNKELLDGVAQGTITDADYIPQYTVTRFDAFGRQEEIKDAMGVYTSNIFDHFPKGSDDKTNVFTNNSIANITNAHFFECGALTCDYDGNPGTVYIDKTNYWERGMGNDAGLSSPEVTLVSSPVHFGKKCLKVKHAYGPSRNFRIFNDGGIRDYVLTAWVKPDGVSVEKGKVIGADYRRRIDDAPYWNNDLVSGTADISVTEKNGWYYVELPIPASQDLAGKTWGNGWGVRVWVGAPNGPSGSYVYVDDIRFFPKDALITTRFLDDYRDNVVAEVGPNNNAKFYSYDSFDRIVQVKNNSGQTIEEYSYNLMGPGPHSPTNFSASVSGNTATFSWLSGSSMASDNITYTVRAIPWSGHPGLPFGGSTTAPGSQSYVSLTVADIERPVGAYHWYVSVDRGFSIKEYYAGSFGW